MAELNNSLYRFGEFELDPTERRLSSTRGPVALTPRSSTPWYCSLSAPVAWSARTS